LRKPCSELANRFHRLVQRAANAHTNAPASYLHGQRRLEKVERGPESGASLPPLEPDSETAGIALRIAQQEAVARSTMRTGRGLGYPSLPRRRVVPSINNIDRVRPPFRLGTRYAPQVHLRSRLDDAAEATVTEAGNQREKAEGTKGRGFGGGSGVLKQQQRMQG
jgi:hypothetical protein